MATRIDAEPLEEGRFAPFGRVLRLPDAGSVAPTIARPNVKLFGDMARIAAVGDDVEFGLAVLDAREPGLSEMERHLRSAELLFAVRGDFVLPLAAPEAEEPAAGHVRAFMIPEGHGCVLHAATWHWAPYPTGARCEVLVAFRAGTPVDDMIIAPLAAGEEAEMAWRT